MKRWNVLAMALLAVVGGCQFRPDPYCPGGQVVVTKCAVCRLVWTGAGYACAGPDEYAAAAAATQPASRPAGTDAENQGPDGRKGTVEP
jgi:hypothetical protein